VRIDSIEEAILDSGALSSPIDDAGYRVGNAVAADNLRIGRTVIADSVNPIPLSRDAWLEVANRAQVSAVEIEVICSDTKEHQRRVEARISDIAGLRSLTWQDVVSRDYRPWDREHIVIDTAGRSVEQVVAILRGVIAKQ
jgi:predicted kinase